MLGSLSRTPCPPHSTAGYALWVEIVIHQLQLVVVPKAAKDGPGGFVSAPLDEECVEEEEACRRDQAAQTQWGQPSLGDPLLGTTLSLGKQAAWTERSSSHSRLRLALTRGTN